MDDENTQAAPDAESKEEQRKQVTVACSVVGGVSIRRYAPGHDDGTGKNPTVPTGPEIVIPGPSSAAAGVNNMQALRPVLSSQDEEFMSAWMKENERNPLVASGQIKIVKPDEEDEA